jgi:ribosomal protein L11 methyltransferase
MSEASEAPRFPYVVVDVTPAEADEVSALLFELGAQGVEERDASTLVRGGAAGVTLVASFATHDEAKEALGELPEPWAGRLEEVVGDAWRDEWKKHFRPFDLCEGIVVRPPWEPWEEARGFQVLTLEPGRAFGTGLHETTALVAEALRVRKGELAGAPILDVGCGSGILSLVALALGAARARAVDVDPDAVLVTRENAVRNGFEGRVTADTTDVRALDGQWPVVVANIEASVLKPMAAALRACVAPGGLLVLSGVLVPQADDVRAAYAAFELEDSPSRGEWTALVLRAPRAPRDPARAGDRE